MKQMSASAETPADRGALLRVLDRWRGHPVLDDAFAQQVAAARAGAAAELDPDRWRG